jgi:hypothetical protein
MKVIIIEAIFGNYSDDSNKSVLIAITESDKNSFVGRSIKDAKSILEFVGVEITKDEFLINVRVPSIFLGASIEQDVEVISNAFNNITNNFK